MTKRKMDEFRKGISRRAIVLDLGGFRPPSDLCSSWFGDVTVSLPGEGWPQSDGKPMHALAQVNLNEFPFKPVGLEDIEFMTIFIGPDSLPIDAPNGQKWALRTYNDASKLEAIERVESGSALRKLPMRCRVIENDYPCWDEIAHSVPEELEDSYSDICPNTDGFKFGGWPTLIQSEIFWTPLNSDASNPMYVFQIDSTEKGCWAWGDSGVGYFGRFSSNGKHNNWALSWQCM